MSARPAPSRTVRRLRRAGAATALLGAAAVLAAPAAFADTPYNQTALPPNTEVLGVKYDSAAPASGGQEGSAGAAQSAADPGSSGSGTQVLGVKYGTASGSLAFTGFEAGAVGLLGSALVAGGVVLLVGSRRRSSAGAAS